MDASIIRPAALSLFLLALLVALIWWFSKRAKAVLQLWADDNGFEILEAKRHYWFSTGPFLFWTNSRNQVVFSFRARDRLGRERSGWARCGSFWEGVLFSDQIEIRWDEP